MSEPITADHLAQLSLRAAQLELALRDLMTQLQKISLAAGDLASDVSETETRMALGTDAQLFDVDLACGDTIASALSPAIGSYRKCIHCDSRKRVVRVRLGDVVTAVESSLATDEAALSRLRRMLAGEEL